MSRPINEDDVIKIIRMMPPENGITAMIEQGIKQLPSAQRESCEYWDAESNYCTLNRPSARPEIIRCENCKYCRKEDESEYWCYGFCSPPRLVRKDDFCSYGCKNE